MNAHPTRIAWFAVACFAVLAVLLGPTARAQKPAKKPADKPAVKEAKADAAPDEKKAPTVIALQGGKVITVTGRTIRCGTVLIKDGKIEAVGDEVEVPDGAEIVDCRGKVVMPGFVPALAWGAGLATLGRGFIDDGAKPSCGHDHGDCTHDDETCTHGFAPAEATAPAGGLVHTHSPGCLCKHLNWVYEVQSPGKTEMELLRHFLPDGRVLATARAIRLATAADPFFRTVRETELLNPAISTADVVKDALDPFGRSLILLNAAGITSSWIPGPGSLPAMAMLFGMASPPTAGTGGVVLKYDRDRLDGMHVSTGRFLVMDLRSVLGLKRRTLLNELEDTARYRRETVDYAKAKSDYDKAKKKYRADKKAGKEVGSEPRSPSKPKKPAAATKWEPLLDGKRVLRVWAETVAQIRFALHIADRYGIELVIDDAVEGWAIAPEIARAGAAVVVNPRRVVEVTKMAVSNPSRVYHHGSHIENAAILAKHGVRVSVVPPAPALIAMGVGGRDLLTLTLDAAFAMRGGLSHADAVKSITLHPATLLGIGDRTGSLEPGKDADVVVLDGDPFDHKTFVELTYVNGRLVYEKDKEPLFDHVKRGRLAKKVWTWPPAGQ